MANSSKVVAAAVWIVALWIAFGPSGIRFVTVATKDSSSLESSISESESEPEGVELQQQQQQQVEEDSSCLKFKVQIQRLNTKISSLKSIVSATKKELKLKDDNIAVLDKFLKEKSAGVAKLQSEILSLKKNSVIVAEEQVGKAHVRAGELEKEVSNLKIEIELLSRENEALEARVSQAEKKVHELNPKLETLEKANEDLKHKLQKTERALQVAEEELMRAQLEATSKSKILNEIHGAWLPPWLAKQLSRFQDQATDHWNEHGKPAIDVFLQKASEKSAKAKKWAEPHLEIVYTKWIPAVKGKLVTFITYIEPHVQTISSKSIEAYEVCRNTITPHFVRLQEFTVPYLQETRRLSKPYIDQIAVATKPHVEKVRGVVKPYTKHGIYAYGKFLESATTYHHQVQGAVQEKLKQHELTKTLATKELVWFMASALLALPILILYKIFLAMFCKKSRKPSEVHANQAQRRHKRRHAEK